MSAVARAMLPVLAPPPRTRGECADLPRPCPCTGCRHHLAPDAGEEGPFVYSCALDAADDGPHTLDEVAAILGTSREAIREIEMRALRTIAHAMRGPHAVRGQEAHRDH